MHGSKPGPPAAAGSPNGQEEELSPDDLVEYVEDDRASILSAAGAEAR
jgi:hypothetical protein